MAKITFSRSAKRIDHPRHGFYHGHEFATCDLARPTAELEAIALIMKLAPWQDEVLVQDATLHARLDYRAPYVLQERALHQLLAIARRLLAQSLDHLATMDIPVAPVPVRNERRDYLHGRGAVASLRDGGEFRMPEGHYGAGFAVDMSADGPFGYFLTSSLYDGETRVLAAALLRLAVPEAGIGAVAEQSYGEMPVANPVARLGDVGAVCHSIAYGLKARMTAELERLAWNGAPSAFTPEDDDARDALLARVKAGLRIGRLLRDDASHNDPDCRFTYVSEDGEEFPGDIVERLVGAELLVPEDGFWGRSPVLEAAETITDRNLNPRAHTVSFKAFESYCPHRRHDGQRECLNRCNRTDYCLESSCPLVTQVYTRDLGRSYMRRFEEEPAFDPQDDWTHDPQVYAISRNTERSYAWRAAGADGMAVVVNTAIRSKLAYDAGHLFETPLLRHVRRAVEEGHLVIVQEMEGMGVVATPSEKLMAEISAMQEERRRQETEAAKVDA